MSKLREFVDKQKRALDTFQLAVESGQYKPLLLTDLAEVTELEWWQLFEKWRSVQGYV